MPDVRHAAVPTVGFAGLAGEEISIDVFATVACALLTISWAGFVAWRVAMNAHRRGGLYDKAR